MSLFGPLVTARERVPMRARPSATLSVGTMTPTDPVMLADPGSYTFLHLLHAVATSVPGAGVTVTNQATQIARPARTDHESFYVVTNLPPGDYQARGLMVFDGYETNPLAPSELAAPLVSFTVR